MNHARAHLDLKEQLCNIFMIAGWVYSFCELLCDGLVDTHYEAVETKKKYGWINKENV